MKKELLTLFDPFEVLGVWWLPEKPNQCLTGILTFLPKDRFVLRVVGSFSDLSTNLSSTTPPQYGIILGVVEGTSVTICNPLQTNSQVYTGDAPWSTEESTFISTIVLFGKHFESRDEIKFHSMTIAYTHLEEWLNQRPIATHVDHEDGKLKSASATFSWPESTEFEVPSIASTFKWSPNVFLNDSRRSILEWCVTSQIKVTPSNAQNIA